jgi:hypothetical protein
VTLASGDAITLSANVGGAGSGTVTVNTNTNGAGADNFTMAAGSSITTTNATGSAVAINVNAATGGTGGAALRGITTGSRCTIAVATNSGATPPRVDPPGGGDSPQCRLGHGRSITPAAGAAGSGTVGRTS